jgi:hypothetical protein
MAYANPSGNATSVPNLGLAEQIPIWSFGATFDVGPRNQRCTLGSNNIPLQGDALSKYAQLKSSLLSFLATPTASCSAMLNPVLANNNSDFTALLGAINQQVPYDGVLSNLSMYDAGTWTDKDTYFPTWPKYRTYAICGQFWNGSIWSGTVALAQTQAPSTNVYIASQPVGLKNLTQSTLLHEALHNLLKLRDKPLYESLSGQNLQGPSDAINKVLISNQCAQN